MGVIGVLGGAAILSGFVDNPGKMVYVDKSTNYTLTLYGDKTFAYEEYDGTFSGTYRIDGDHVLLTFDLFGVVFDFLKKGNTLIDTKDGTVWERI